MDIRRSVRGRYGECTLRGSTHLHKPSLKMDALSLPGQCIRSSGLGTTHPGSCATTSSFGAAKRATSAAASFFFFCLARFSLFLRWASSSEAFPSEASDDRVRFFFLGLSGSEVLAVAGTVEPAVTGLAPDGRETGSAFVGVAA